MDNKLKVGIGIGIFLLLLAITFFIYFQQDTSGILPDNVSGDNQDQGENGSEDNLSEEDTDMDTISDFTELGIKILQEGEGAEAKEGDTVVVDYKGLLTDGSQFDSSYDRGTPFEFTLGQNMVIIGWEDGVKGMKVGEIRELKIPSSMGYGENGAGEAIPANAGLIFTIEMLEIK